MSSSIQSSTPSPAAIVRETQQGTKEDVKLSKGSVDSKTGKSAVSDSSATKTTKGEKGKGKSLFLDRDFNFDKLLDTNQKSMLLSKPKLEPSNYFSKQQQQKTKKDLPVKQQKDTTENKGYVVFPAGANDKQLAEAQTQTVEEPELLSEESEEADDTKNEQRTATSKSKKDAVKAKSKKTQQPVSSKKNGFKFSSDSQNKLKKEQASEKDSNIIDKKQDVTTAKLEKNTKNIAKSSDIQGETAEKSSSQSTNVKGSDTKNPQSSHNTANFNQATTNKNNQYRSTYRAGNAGDTLGNDESTIDQPRVTVGMSNLKKMDDLKKKIKLLNKKCGYDYVSGRGTYSAILMLISQKIKKMQMKNIVDNLKVETQNRQAASGRRRAERQEQKEKREKAEELNKIQKYLAVAISCLALVITVAISCGSAGVALIPAIIGVIGAVGSLGITVADMPCFETWGDDGVKRGAFSTSIYKLCSKFMSDEDAAKASKWIVIGLQIAFALLCVVSGFQGIQAGPAAAASAATKHGIMRALSKATQVISHVGHRGARRIAMLFGAMGEISQGAIGIYEGKLQKEAYDIQNDLKELEALFLKIEFNEDVLKDRMKSVISELEEFANVSMKIIDSEAKLISAFNRRSKIA